MHITMELARILHRLSIFILLHYENLNLGCPNWNSNSKKHMDTPCPWQVCIFQTKCEPRCGNATLICIFPSLFEFKSYTWARSELLNKIKIVVNTAKYSEELCFCLVDNNSSHIIKNTGGLINSECKGWFALFQKLTRTPTFSYKHENLCTGLTKTLKELENIQNM